jgi:hypothetical protein
VNLIAALDFAKELGVPSASNFNGLLCPTDLNRPFARKGQFCQLSNRRRRAASRTSQPLHGRGFVGTRNQREAHGGASLASVVEYAPRRSGLIVERLNRVYQDARERRDRKRRAAS